MKNKFSSIFVFIIFYFLSFSIVFGNDQFNFDVTEGQIIEKGNKFLGKKGGTATTADGIIITAKNFEYNKLLNILNISGNVVIEDTIKDFIIYSDKAIYLKNKEIIFTEGNSKAIDPKGVVINADNFTHNKNLNTLKANGKVKIKDITKNLELYSDSVIYFRDKEVFYSKGNSKAIDENGVIINAENFVYNKISNILEANKKVEIEDLVENYIIFSEEVTYLRNFEQIFTKGKTDAIVHSKYNFISKDILLDKVLMELSSVEKSIIQDDKSTIYNVDKFKYLINKKLLKGENVVVETNHLNKKSDKYYFKNGFFNFKNNNFISKDTKILLHNRVFDKERTSLNKKNLDTFKSKNDPRILGSSSVGNNEKIVLKNAIFTSCKKNDSCPPWSIKSKKITHDRVKKELIYDHAVVRVFDLPVFYFPKFFHPDPSVKRRSGFLQPRLNNSNILGTSINTPYFHEISANKDFTFKPTIFDNRIYMFQNEYRQENQNSSFIADFSYTKGYKSKLSNNRNSISHLFSKYKLDLGWQDYKSSRLKVFVEKVSNDTYLKIFDSVLLTDKNFTGDLNDKSNLTSGLTISLDHEDYLLSGGIIAYESLSGLNSDRYQYVLPYYDFTKTLFSNYEGSLNFISSGSNSLSKTNNLRSRITNDINYKSYDNYSSFGFANNFGIYFRNLNTVAKNDTIYKTSPQTELLNIYEISSSLPLIKIDQGYSSYFTPKVSFRINPSDMKDYSENEKLITADNIFDINRLGIGDSYEAGKSVTLGIDYKKESNFDVNKYLEIKFGTVFRETSEDKIPKSSSINNRGSNLFGSIENKFSELLTVDYDFSIDNDLNTFEVNSIDAKFTVNNFVSEFIFLEKNGKAGETNSFENITTVNFDENNSLWFKTRRNRKISLTEYYDFIYEYQNDCLTAAIKYRKTFYTDRDLKPKEDLFFSITLFPLTTFDQEIDQSLIDKYRNERKR